jgi:hypothetical protein
MFRSQIVMAILLAGITALTLQARQAPSDVEQEVLAAQQRLTQAQAECASDLMTLRMPNHVIIGETGGLLTGEAVLRDNDSRCRKTRPTQREDVRVRVFDGNTAVITGIATMFRGDGSARPKGRFTSVWVKNNGQWRHASFQLTSITDQP